MNHAGEDDEIHDDAQARQTHGSRRAANARVHGEDGRTYRQSGRLLDGEGLGATKTRSRVSFKSGRRTVTHGPYAGAGNELPASVAKIAVTSLDEAIAWASEMAKAIGGDVELEVGKIKEAWDMGFGEKPADAPERYLVVNKVTTASEAGGLLILESAAQQVKAPAKLLASVVLTPTSQGKRLVVQGGQRTVLDGPFMESKELIGGYAILDMPSWEECITSCFAYADILSSGSDDIELDIRPLHEVTR